MGPIRHTLVVDPPELKVQWPLERLQGANPNLRCRGRAVRGHMGATTARLRARLPQVAIHQVRMSPEGCPQEVGGRTQFDYRSRNSRLASPYSTQASVLERFQVILTARLTSAVPLARITPVSP